MATIPQDDDCDIDAFTESAALPKFMTALAGETAAANDLHAAARAALMNLLQSDPDVAAVIECWVLETEAGRNCAALGLAYEQIDDIARGAGYQDIQTLLDSTSDGKVTIEVETTEDAERLAQALNHGIRTCCERADDALAALQNSDPNWLADRFAALVRDQWQLPWPWVVGELLQLWEAWLNSALFHQRTTITYWVESCEYEQPAPVLSFQTQPGESIGSALERCFEEIVSPLAVAANDARIPNGRRTAPKIVERYVSWWYRRRIHGEAWLQIAGDIDRRSHVKYGVKQAESWLDASSWGWKD